MHYLIYVADEEGEERLFVGPVAEADKHYLDALVVPNLRSLNDDEYIHGFAAILHSFAKYSYILSAEDIFWCVEWDPGLIVIKFASDGRMFWAAIRSPIPEFGGRDPLPEDEEAYDEDRENHQYNLVFHAWDSQFDAQKRTWLKFEPASQETAETFEAALKWANSLGEIAKERYATSFQQWAKDCRQNIERWAGEGLRLGATT